MGKCAKRTLKYPSVTRGRILVADDDSRNVKLITAILGTNAFECLPAFGGEDALRVAREKLPDLVLLDIMMPDIDGYRVTRELKASPETAAIPIVMITSLNGEEDKAKALACGAEEFLTKPVNAVELLARVNSMLRVKQYRDPLALRAHPGISPAAASHGRTITWSSLWTGASCRPALKRCWPRSPTSTDCTAITRRRSHRRSATV